MFKYLYNSCISTRGKLKNGPTFWFAFFMCLKNHQRRRALSNSLATAAYNSMAIKVVYNAYFITLFLKNWECALSMAQIIKIKKKSIKNSENKKKQRWNHRTTVKRGKVISVNVPRFMVHHTQIKSNRRVQKKKMCINVYGHAAGGVRQKNT